MSSKLPLLVIGTANRKKGAELEQLFAKVGVKLLALADFPDVPQVPEDGETFAANAILKASGYAKLLGHWVLADDSGLLVDALGGEPGVYSARYAGPEATDEQNNQLLLRKLADVPPERRGARFVCHIALADPTGTIRAESDAACRGRILFAPQGNHGFGYDPLFTILEYHRSFAELGPTAKFCLSHRSRAARRIIPQLMGLVDEGEMG
ncbi:MAG: RdgB/HAM1 family non-canonical purine NTP pyrophosphatase [Pirellulales bacterium]|nr:RdgB/HAM1 family non-canonical purine NTP pyrophosphatase [Pirellulales bacterium]